MSKKVTPRHAALHALASDPHSGAHAVMSVDVVDRVFAALTEYACDVSRAQVAELYDACGDTFAFNHAVQSAVHGTQITARHSREDVAARRRAELQHLEEITASASSGGITCRGCGAASVIVQQKQHFQEGIST